MRERLLRTLVSSIEDCTHKGDCTCIMSEQAVRDARALIRLIDNSPEDIPVQSVVGHLHWIRYELGKAAGVEDCEAERRVAIAHFSPVHAGFPDAVPDDVREYLDERQKWGARASALIDQGPLPGGLVALDEAVDLLQKIVLGSIDDDPMLPIPLTELAVALGHRFQLTKRIEDLQRALTVLDKAISLTHVDDPERLNRQSVRKLFLVTRYDHLGEVNDLDEAIRIGDNVLNIASPDNPQFAAMTADLIHLYKRRYDHTMAITDLDVAVTYGRRALNLAIDDDERRASIMDDLGIVLRRRGERTGDRDSLESAVTLHRDAANIIPVAHYDWLGICNNLGLALRVSGETIEDATQLRESVEALQYVVLKSKEKGHPDLSGFLQNLGISQNMVYRMSNELSDLRDAVASLRESAAAFAGPSARGALSDLGNVLYELSEATDNLTPLNEAVKVHRRAVADSAPGDPATALMQVNLAATLRGRYLREHAKEDRIEAIRYLRPVATLDTTPPSLRLRAARLWGWLEADAGNWSAADTGFGLAVELLPRVAAQNLRRVDQERHLRREPRFIADAVAAALQIGDIDRAAVLFEQGRGVLTAQALNLRTDLSRLTQKDSRLASEFTRLRDALDSTSDPDRRHHWTNEWEELLRKIRSLKGFSGFLLPMTASEIRTAACDGPIVMVNISDHRSDALVVRTDRIDVVKLPQLTPKTLEINGIRFLTALEIVLNSRLSEGQRDQAGSAIRQGLQWLWDAIAGPVLSHLGLHKSSNDGRLKRLWWSPSSLLTFLPLHAAQNANGDKILSVLDMVVSSYTPTLRALQHARGRELKIEASVGPLVVAMPETRGQHELPGAQEEAEFIKQEFSGTVSLIGEMATKESVLRRLPEHSWVHFTCHGTSALEDPSASYLHLAGSDPKLTVLDISKMRIEGEIAFLSACNTSQPGLALIDEAVHLAGAFQLAGYRHVMAAMWPIYDRIAVEVARYVYGSIRSVAHSAAILSRAVRTVRERCPDEPWMWASYVHVGP